MYNKNDIDKQAEREATALSKQGFRRSYSNNRTRQQSEYNQDKFNKLFRN